MKNFRQIWSEAGRELRLAAAKAMLENKDTKAEAMAVIVARCKVRPKVVKGLPVEKQASFLLNVLIELPEMNDNLRKLDYIDALRGFAVLAVILVHARELASSAGAIAAQGARGVQLFFVISAFTLLLSMTSRKAHEAHFIRNFFIRRFFRIAPLFYIAVCVSLLIDGLSPRYWAPQGLHIADVFATVFFVNGWNAYTINSIVPGGWSIAVEMTFYAMLPLLFKYVRTFHRALFCWASALVFGILMSPVSAWIAGPSCPDDIAFSFNFLWLPTQFPVFMSGFMLYFALRERFKTLRFLTAQASCLLLLGAVELVNRFFSLHLRLHPTVAFAGVCASVLAYTLAHVQAPILVNPLTRHIGKVSYSGYISQFWVIRLLLPAKASILLLPVRLRLPFAFCLAAACTVLLSTALHKVIEVPLQNVGRKLIDRLECESVPLPAPADNGASQ